MGSTCLLYALRVPLREASWEVLVFWPAGALLGGPGRNGSWASARPSERQGALRCHLSFFKAQGVLAGLPGAYAKGWGRAGAFLALALALRGPAACCGLRRPGSHFCRVPLGALLQAKAQGSPMKPRTEGPSRHIEGRWSPSFWAQRALVPSAPLPRSAKASWPGKEARQPQHLCSAAEKGGCGASQKTNY